MMLPNVALRISSIGTAMTVAISATDGGRVRTAVAVPPGPAGPSGPSGSAGSSRDASSSAAMNSSGTSTWIRLPMNDPHQTPLTSHAGIPQIRPMRMSQPRLTPSSPEAATGPGCGGRNACVMDRPASIGSA